MYQCYIHTMLDARVALQTMFSQKINFLFLCYFGILFFLKKDHFNMVAYTSFRTRFTWRHTRDDFKLDNHLLIFGLNFSEQIFFKKKKIFFNYFLISNSIASIFPSTHTFFWVLKLFKILTQNLLSFQPFGSIIKKVSFFIDVFFLQFFFNIKNSIFKILYYIKYRIIQPEWDILLESLFEYVDILNTRHPCITE